MKKMDFDIHFDHAFSKKNMTKFEDWFVHMASCVYGTDFETIKAGGPSGDKKCDGRRISTETVFQCYAPESPGTFAKNAKGKIADSFPAVVEDWPNLREWILVHNNDGGLPPSASNKLEELRDQFPKIKISTASRIFLKDELHNKLSMLQMVDIYPNARLNFNDVQMEHIRPLLNKIIETRRVEPDSSNFGDIPNESKLDFNKLDPDSKYVIRRARPYVGVVDKYIAGMSIPQNASILQAEMNAEYRKFKDFEYSPDEIMGKLHEFCGGSVTPTMSAAAYVILAYYLDACDIFENVLQDDPC
jgi:hypothetical protein